MAGYNTRGGDALSYSLGRGKLYLQGEIQTFDVSGNPVAPSADMAEVGGWRDIGNVTNFTFSQESETKEHRSNLSGLQTIDIELAVSQKATVSFTADEINSYNLARFFAGTLYDPKLGYGTVNAASVASDDSTLVSLGMTANFYIDTATTDVVHDVWIDLYLTMNITGVGNFGKVSPVDFEANATQAILVRKAATTRTATDGTLLTEGTHYEIDRKFGRIRFPNVAGGLAAGDTIQVKWAAPTTPKFTTPGLPFDSKLSIVSILATSGKTVALKFISENPNNGDVQARLELWKVKLRPDGEFSGIGDDWSQLSFTGSLESISNPPQGSSPYGRWTIREGFST